MLSCALNERGAVLEKCTAEHVQTKRMFYIQEGLLDSGFSAYKSDFSRGVCQFEIPRGGEEDSNLAGSWFMTLTYQSSKKDHPYGYNGDPQFKPPAYKTGSFILEANTTLEKQRLLKRAESRIVLKTES